jgi:hypothetical protein
LKRLADKYDIIVEVDHLLSYEECINRKKDAHIIIDECITGSFHKTTLEALEMQAIPVVWIRKALINKHIQLYKRPLPAMNTTITNLETSLSSLIEIGKPALEDIAIKLNKKFLDYWTPEIVVNEFDDIYSELINTTV